VARPEAGARRWAQAAPGLRTQLVVGLAIILLVATVSVGAITHWATGRQLSQLQLEHARLVGEAHARAAAIELSRDPVSIDNALGGRRSPLLAHVELIDREGGHLAGDRLAPGTDDDGPRRALRTGEQVARLVSGALLEISTPVTSKGQVLGVVRLRMPAASETVRWPALFWLLMGLDSLVLVLFVGLAITRYVARPVGAMQRAAARIAAGDLAVRLEERGAYELSSLAESFNKMTESLQEQMQRLEQQRESLVRSEKLASVGRLAAGVAHEVGNPLQSIVGFSDLLLEGGLDAQTERDALRRVQDEAQRIHRIVGELLDYSRPVEDAVEPVRLDQLVRHALALVRPQRRFRRVTVESHDLSQLPPAAASTQRVAQVLVNLLLNAADATDGQGSVWISGEATAGGDVELRVANDGPPIPAEHRERIFDPFFSTKEPGQGSGLGLSVSASIIESYGGRLELDAEGSRTTFVIRLPIHGGHRRRDSPPSSHPLPRRFPG
jgi:signal transduction histidine kinase